MKNNPENKEDSIVKYLIDKQELRMPKRFLKGKAIKELDKALGSGRALFVSGQYKKMLANIDEYFDIDDIEAICLMVKDMEKASLSEGFNTQVSSDNQKIIDFLTGNKANDIVDFLEMAGPYYFFLEVAGELEKSRENTPELIRVVLIMWLFVNTYEILLHQVDRKILHNIRSDQTIKRTGNVNFFLNNILRKQFSDHATAEKINRALCDILKLKEDNNSIFGKTSQPKVIRNKISHSNMYYDKDVKKIILLSGEEYGYKEFVEQYFEMFNFMTAWLKKYSDLNDVDKLKGKMKNELGTLLNALSKDFLFVERSAKVQYSDFIVNIKKEMAEKQKKTTNLS
jgi:hypothetical protein